MSPPSLITTTTFITTTAITIIKLNGGRGGEGFYKGSKIDCCISAILNCFLGGWNGGGSGIGGGVLVMVMVKVGYW